MKINSFFLSLIPKEAATVVIIPCKVGKNFVNFSDDKNENTFSKTFDTVLVASIVISEISEGGII